MPLGPRLTLIVRRTHMYLALFLAPWMLMYALSTMAMNHRSLFHGSAGPPGFQPESVRTWSNPLPASARPAEIARRILRDIDMEGTHTVNASRDGARITILRQHPVTPRRIVFTPADGKLVVEKQPLETLSFLERMHRRRSFMRGFAVQNAWAASVDLAVAAILFWAVSGVWLCWSMQRTRFWGAVFAGAGCVLFGLFLITI